MAQTKVEQLMATYAAMAPSERIEFRAMMAGYDMRSQTSQNAGKKAAETKRKAKPEAKAAEA